MTKKSIYYNFNWVSFLLLGLGAFFLLPAWILQIVPIGPNNFNLTLNGVSQPYTAENVHLFRRIFLLAFGIPAVTLVVVGIVILAYQIKKRRKERELLSYGTFITCHQLSLSYSNIRINYQYKPFLTCSYTDQRGDTYLFKSRILRYDPIPYLNDTVNVYFDENKPTNYFVDVDGSLENVYEL